MSDCKVGDIVICKDQRHRLLGRRVFEIVSTTGESTESFVKVRDIKTGGTEDGWYVGRFELYNLDGVADCKYCISKCKKESPCEFYQSVESEII